MRPGPTASAKATARLAEAPGEGGRPGPTRAPTYLTHLAHLTHLTYPTYLT
jgi:hypothetical protein